MADFVRKHIGLILGLTREAMIHETNTEFSKQGWFLYFWKEARGEAGMRGKSREIPAFFNDLFVLPKEWDPAAPEFQLEERGIDCDYKAGVPENAKPQVLAYKPGKNWDNVDDTATLNLLNGCLAVGFQRPKPPVHARMAGRFADAGAAWERRRLYQQGAIGSEDRQQR